MITQRLLASALSPVNDSSHHHTIALSSTRETAHNLIRPIMKKQPLLLLGLLAYITLPSLHGWLMDPDGHWLRPFAIWLLVAVTTLVHDRLRAQP